MLYDYEPDEKRNSADLLPRNVRADVPGACLKTPRPSRARDERDGQRDAQRG